ncbi:MAG: hypothetical protein ACI30S_08390 [Muribaculaceae bacterium]
MEIRGVDGGREASRPYDKRVEIRGIEADVTRHVPTIIGWKSVE